MSKLNKAIEVVKATGAENKEACLAAIMEACATYRSNATIYFNKAVERINGGVVTKAPKSSQGSPTKKAKGTKVDVAAVKAAQPALANILNNMAKNSMEDLAEINAERVANGMTELTLAQFQTQQGRIAAYLKEAV